MHDPYTEDYYLHGVETGLSLYTDYRWLPALTIPMVCRIVEHLAAAATDTFLDFGCARGYTVRALRAIGYAAEGVDVSEWAITHADPVARPYVRQGRSVTCPYDWIIAKDVLEHIPDGILERTIDNLLRMARKGLFIVVPLSDMDGAPYVVPEYEADVTHVQRRTLRAWMQMFLTAPQDDARPRPSVTGVYRMDGIKDNYAHYSQGNGFITVMR